MVATAPAIRSSAASLCDLPTCGREPGDGIRAAKIEDPDGTPTKTYFIIDTNNPTGYAQVLEEYEANSSGQTLKKSYVIGRDGHG